MSEPRELLVRLLDYIKEQAQVVDPNTYQLSTVKTFVRRPKDLMPLPGVETDLHLEGDHIWLRVTRLKPEPAPIISDNQKALLRPGPEPDGPPPGVDQQAVGRQVNRIVSTLPPEKRQDPKSRAEVEAEQFAQAKAMLDQYMPAWSTWAAAERPRRKTISLYGDLFALKQQLEAQEAVKPQELVWGMGIARWKIKDGKDITQFEYPLLTQALEISIEDDSMAIDLRPRATDTCVELDAFFACNVSGVLQQDLPRPHNDGVDRAEENDQYSLELPPLLSEFAGRLYIDWGDGKLAWNQRAAVLPHAGTGA